ncbi:methylglyoxal synthase [Chroococcidiopsis sp. CCALA 051]|uniref:methylglyoxal synthase n=1 Tax=Chroococcidiopsis sp. CCALA 051 TaxID=869949 RepID=UPI000D0E1F67|nr:methylglyoxal synthase [Chroococcidiopsis sp. CCALA 051]MBE9014588.1 methylglyoxal synthase [Chroococcidiopsidales cyanobacterium LEGE 13417]PSM48947.1 methylglyoxal synthase [Chroococcidiopsis sp. CCALA 051]
MPSTIALIAHDSRKDDIVRFAFDYAPTLSRYHLIATAKTADVIQAATGLPVEQKLTGSLGGVIQIAAEVASGNVLAVIFLVDPLAAQTEPKLDTLLHICNVHNVALATNLATASALATRLAKTRVAHLIFNPVAGQRNAQQDLSLIRQLLEPHLSLRIHQTTPEVNPEELVKTAISSGADIVIAAGGDGTVSTVAGALIGTGISLGIIPRGTANAFAVALGIPGLLPIRNACEVILAEQSQTIDAACCNGFPLILLAGIGYEAAVVENASRELKDRWGTLAYLMAGWQTIDEQQLFDIDIEAEGNIYQFQAGAITIANAAPPTSVLAQGAGQVIWDDGLLDVTIVTAQNKLHAVTTMLKMLGAAIAKTQVNQQNVIHGRTHRLKVTANPPQKVVVDGEIVGTTPVEVECIPSGLTVLVPKSFSAS